MINILDTVLNANKDLEERVKEAGGDLSRVKGPPPSGKYKITDALSRRYVVGPDKTSALPRLLDEALGAVSQGLMDMLSGIGPVQWTGFSIIIATEGDRVSLHVAATTYKINKE